MARSNHMTSPTTHPDEYTRTRLLNRLGLFQQHPTAVAAGRRRYPSTAFSKVDFSKTTLHPSLVRNGKRTSTLKSALAKKEKDEKGKKDLENSEHNNNITSRDDAPPDHKNVPSSPPQNSKNNAKIRFNEKVDIVSIPSRHQFSNRIKNVYWSDRYELQENAERNILEYEYEGWDYHNVVLDDEMYVDVNTGTLIHPCHLSVDESTGQTVYQTYSTEDQEDERNANSSAEDQEISTKLKLPDQKQVVDGDDDDDEDDGFEYEYDDSKFRPLQRKPSVASSQ